MKFICEECAEPCILEVGDCYNVTADVLQCIIKNSCYCKWKEFKGNQLPKSSSQSVTNCNRLPKLTAEVFSRPDCPEWAKWAAVDKYRNAMWYAEEPKTVGSVFWNSHSGQIQEIPGKFDASDWENSLIARSKVNWDEVEKILCNSKLTFKEKKQELPDWCMVGAWCYCLDDDGNGKYFKITEIKDNFIYGKDWDIDYHFIRQARIRPYNAEEIPDLPFEVTERNSNFRTTVVSCAGNNVWLGGASTAISTEELMRDFTAKGSPCGILEHWENGEWVK